MEEELIDMRDAISSVIFLPGSGGDAYVDPEFLDIIDIIPDLRRPTYRGERPVLNPEYENGPYRFLDGTPISHLEHQVEAHNSMTKSRDFYLELAEDLGIVKLNEQRELYWWDVELFDRFVRYNEGQERMSIHSMHQLAGRKADESDTIKSAAIKEIERESFSPVLSLGCGGGDEYVFVAFRRRKS